MTAPRFQVPGAMAVLATSMACGATWGYLGELLDRTRFGAHRTSIASDVIVAMYAVCAIALVLAVSAFFNRRIPRYLPIGLLLAAILPTAGFAWLDLSETICEWQKEVGCLPLFHRP